MPSSTNQELADRLFEAEKTRVPIAPIHEDMGDGAMLDDAYAVQAINTERSLAAGRRLVGRKIGLTSRAVQTQLGVDQPDYGMLFADMEIPLGVEVPSDRLIQPKVEAEIAFVMGRDLPNDGITQVDVIRAVEFVLPAIEVVDSRVADWQIGILDTIADNASSGLYVLGAQPVSLANVDLSRCGMVIEQHGQPVSVGAGAACLGHPINAVLWLSQVMARVDRPIRAGDVVLSGALGPMVPAAPGHAFDVRIEGVGSVQAVFSATGEAL